MNEGDDGWLTVVFADRDGDPEIPSAVSYRVDCLTTGTDVRAATAVSPAASVEIEITSTDTAIQDAGNDVERKLLTATASYGDGKQKRGAFVFVVRNLRKAP